MTVLVQLIRMEGKVSRFMLQINCRDGRPIYEQVWDGLRRLIITGGISAGDKLPSVRQLASSLAINPNTIQRAYERLEQDGYAYSVPGKGSFAALPGDVGADRQKELMALLDNIIQELLYLGVTPECIAAQCVRDKRNSAGYGKNQEGLGNHS